MRKLFESMDELEVLLTNPNLDIIAHGLTLKISNSHLCTFKREITSKVDYEVMIKERLQAEILNAIYGDLTQVVCQLATIAKTSKYANIQEIIDLVDKADKIFKGE